MKGGAHIVKRVALITLVLLASSLSYAGDVAQFVNLGFSDDSRYYMFGLYGVVDDGTAQYGELYVVDVAGNRFVPDGVRRKVFDVRPEVGQDGFGAFLTLFRDSVGSTEKHRIDHMKGGRLLYLLIDGEEPKPVLSFRDFESGRSYRIELLQSTFGSGAQVSASFHINLTVSMSGGDRYFTVGLPGYRRDGVQSYRIKRIYSSPDDSSLVFVIEKREYAENGFDVRYMIETVSIR
jgi:predicted secreted protein